MEKKTEVVIVRMGETDKKTLSLLAKSQGRSMSAVVTELIRQSASHTPGQLRPAA